MSIPYPIMPISLDSAERLEVVRRLYATGLTWGGRPWDQTKTTLIHVDGYTHIQLYHESSKRLAFRFSHGSDIVRPVTPVNGLRHFIAYGARLKTQ